MEDQKIWIKNTPEEYQTDVYEEVASYMDLSEMDSVERKFLNGIIKELKPKKLLEVGVSSGASSLVILNAIKDIKNSKLYSIDYSEEWYVDGSKKSGFLVDKSLPELMDKWELFLGGVTAKFIEKIVKDSVKEGFDLCLLDIKHFLPGEVLDFFMILSFMKMGSTIIVHDTNFNNFCFDRHDKQYREIGMASNVLFSTVTANKIQPKVYHNPPQPNIGAFQITEDTLKYIDDLFLALSLAWAYIPTEEDMQYTYNIIKQFYSEENLEKVGKDLFL